MKGELDRIYRIYHLGLIDVVEASRMILALRLRKRKRTA